MHKLVYAFLLSLPLSSLAMMEVASIQAPEELGKLSLYRHENGFSIEQDGYLQHVPNHNVDSNLFKIKPEHFEALGKIGYVKINRLSDGEFKLDLKGRVNGGFLLTGVIVKQVCRGLGYTGLIISDISAITTMTAASGGMGFFPACMAVIAAHPTAVASIEAGSLAIGTAASWIPGLP